jgi:hypothetical protein
MSDLSRDVVFLIERDGQDAAGTALSWALDCAIDGDDVGEVYWLEVADQVMEMEGWSG